MDATQEDINTNQAKTDINLKEMRKEIKSWQAEMREEIFKDLNLTKGSGSSDF
jgi:hypothetical protein